MEQNFLVEREGGNEKQSSKYDVVRQEQMTTLMNDYHPYQSGNASNDESPSFDKYFKSLIALWVETVVNRRMHYMDKYPVIEQMSAAEYASEVSSAK